MADLVIDASPHVIWQAMTTEGGLAPWMGEGARLDPEPGGAVVLPDPVGGETRRGRVERVEPTRRLDFTWWPALRPAERTMVSIQVEPAGSGCRVTVVERPPARLRSNIDASVEPVVARGASAEGGRPVGHRVRQGTGRLPVGLWAWRLAVLSVAPSLCRI